MIQRSQSNAGGGTAEAVFDSLSLSQSVRLAEQRAFLSALGLKDLSQRSLLDLGCGLGGLLAVACEQGLRCGKGIDVSPQSVERAKRLGAEMNLGDRVSFSCGDISLLSRDIGCFDYITAIGVTPYLKDPLVVIDRWSECLNRGGSLFVLFNRSYFLSWLVDMVRFLFSRMPRALHPALCAGVSFVVFPVQKLFSGRFFSFQRVYEKVYQQFFLLHFRRFDVNKLCRRLEKKFYVREIAVPNVEFTCSRTTFLFMLTKKEGDVGAV